LRGGPWCSPSSFVKTGPLAGRASFFPFFGLHFFFFPLRVRCGTSAPANKLFVFYSPGGWPPFRVPESASGDGGGFPPAVLFCFHELGLCAALFMRTPWFERFRPPKGFFLCSLVCQPLSPPLQTGFSRGGLPFFSPRPALLKELTGSFFFPLFSFWYSVGSCKSFSFLQDASQIPRLPFSYEPLRNQRPSFFPFSPFAKMVQTQLHFMPSWSPLLISSSLREKAFFSPCSFLSLGQD